MKNVKKRRFLLEFLVVFIVLSLISVSFFSGAVSSEQGCPEQGGRAQAQPEEFLEEKQPGQEFQQEEPLEQPLPDDETIQQDSMEEDEEVYYRGRVLSVAEEDAVDPRTAPDEGPPILESVKQVAQVRILDEPFRGEVVEVTNHYSERDLYRIYMEEGMEIILVDFSGDLSSEVYLHDIARDRVVYYLVIAFAVLLVLIGGIRGLKALLTLTFTCFFIFKVLLPLMAQGYNAIPVTTASATLLVVVTLLVIGGINKKSYAAIIGTVVGLLAAGFLSLLVGGEAHLTGLSTQEAQMLYFHEEAFDFRQLIFAGIIIGALGAIIDVGISVASAAAEIKEANPDITTIALGKSALNVGRDVMATMSNTMILAYVGAAIPLLLLLTGTEMQWIRIINMEFIATEMIRGITISMGLILSVPATAFFAALFMGRRA